MTKVNIAICGIGTVGGSALKLVQQQRDTIQSNTNLEINISQIAWRNPKDGFDLDGITTTQNALEVTANDDVDIVVELIGGVGIAKELVLQAIDSGKHVVTANKQLLAEHGDEIFAAARANNVVVAFEAAVAGGIPIIKSLREGLAANNINSLAGIINGTSNFILTQMQQHKTPFADVLADAQRLGYAEADPSFDINGNDAAHKLAILARLAFGLGDCLDKIYMQGVSIVTTGDIDYAAHLGYTIKHLGIAKKIDDEFQLGVYPALLKQDQLLANVNGVLNAVSLDGDYVGQCVSTGPGAGGNATASAVVADIIQVARLVATASYSDKSELYVQAEKVGAQQILSIEHSTNSYYLRVSFDNNLDASAVKKVLEQDYVAIEQSIENAKDIVIVTNKVAENVFQQTTAKLQQLPNIKEVFSLRIADFD